ncbi:MAG: hypothetical protein HDT39_15645 [Lachnospiraceae bacterium]|nr:hypothetical protein [Lachnospiraceae bacterium]
MWDEKKFFEDYVTETDKITPDEDFINNLKKVTSEESHSKRSSTWVKYCAAAALVMLCAGLSFVTWRLQYKNNDSKTDLGNEKLHAGSNKEVQSGGMTIITIKTILSYVEDGTMKVEDKEGNAVEENIRSDLIEMLEKAVSTDAKPTEDMKYDEYICKGATNISLKVYEEGYIVVEETGMVYKIIN